MRSNEGSPLFGQKPNQSMTCGKMLCGGDKDKNKHFNRGETFAIGAIAWRAEHHDTRKVGESNVF